MSAFNGEIYEKASADALEFVKRQMDVNNFKYQLSFADDYADDYTGDVMWGYVKGLSVDEDQIFAQYISPDTYYDFSYKGKVTGTVRNLKDYSNYAVNVYVVRDTSYKVVTCPINEDGTWESVVTYREIYTIKKTDAYGNEIETKDVVVYSEDIEVGEGIKEFRLVKNPNTYWLELSSSSELMVEKYICEEGMEISAEEGGYGYSHFSYFTVNIYSYSDTEYINDTCKIWNCGNGYFLWYTTKAAIGHKIGKIMQQVWRDGAVAYDVVGISGSITNLLKGRLPASFLIPTDDPQYNKDGSNALGAYGYMLNSRTWAYDVGLALLVFTTSRDYDLCIEMLQRMEYEQNEDGSFNFSYDIYIGQLFDGYVRVGAMGWFVWGACFYTLESGDRNFVKMIQKAGNWLISKQITDMNDPRYGLLTGGYGNYNMNDYSYSAGEIEWCSVEHQCSALQALEGCVLVLKNKKYKEAAEMVRESLFLKCYDRENGRFYQGINGGKPDEAWALDCTTWAGALIFSVVNSDTAKACLKTAKQVYLTTEKNIVQSSEEDYYNMAYSGNETYSGFKPYSDRTADYENAPDIVWTEGTLGYVLLAYILGEKEEAEKYLLECIKLQNCNGSTGGVIYTTATYAMLPWEFHAWESVVSSSWLYLMIKNPDVLFPRTLRQVYYMARITNIHDERTTE